MSTTTSAPVVMTETAVTWKAVGADLEGQLIRSVAASPNGFVAVSLTPQRAEPRWWESPNGREWTSRPLDLPGFVAGQELIDLQVGGAGFLLAGIGDPPARGPIVDARPRYEDPDTAWLSTDGATWTRVDAGAVAGVPRLGPSLQVSGVVVPVTVSDAGFLVRAGFSARLDVAMLITERFPELQGTAYSVRPGAELGREAMHLLIVYDEAEREVGRISGEDLGIPFESGEGLLEGTTFEGLWFSADGETWKSIVEGPAEEEFFIGLVGPGRWVDGEIGPGLATGCGQWLYAAGNTETAGVKGWRTQDGISWEELAIEGASLSTTMHAIGCVGTDAMVLGNDSEESAAWVARAGGDWERTDDPRLGVHAGPDLFGGAAGLLAGERLPQLPCVDEPCQFLPDIRLTFTAEGSSWGIADRGSSSFGANAMVMGIAVGADRFVAVTEHPMEGLGQQGLDPTSLWVGMPITQPAGTSPPEAEVDRNVEVVTPRQPRSFTIDPNLRILVRVTPDSPVDRVEADGTPVPLRDTGFWGANFETTIRLDPGQHALDLAVMGPGVEEHTLREVTLLPDGDERLGRVTEVGDASITVDWIALDDSGEFLDFVDEDPGVLERLPLSPEVVVILSNTAVPLRWFIDQHSGAYDGAGLRWNEFLLTIQDGTVVQMRQIGLG